MKLPKYREVKELNRQLARTAPKLYRAILASALSQYARLSGDLRGLGLLRSKSYGQLLVYAGELVGQSYPTADLHFAAHQVSALIRKYPWDPRQVGTDPRAAAIDSFLAGEHRCKRVNQWFRARHRPGRRRRPDQWEYYLNRMRGYFRYVLGDTPDYSSILDKADLTGGASLGVGGDATNLGRKLLAKDWTVTGPALELFAAALSQNFHFATRVARSKSGIQSLHVSRDDVFRKVALVSANKIAFVPKQATTHRSVAKEPLGNGLCQKGTDVEMRNHLKRVGIDLSDQTLNQRLAREGSLDDGEDGFVTLDLRNASNSNALALVREVAPRDWFLLWDRLRSPSYDLDGVVRRYEMICSMGNGFCFPLETLLFASVCHAVNAGKAGEDWAVYGDDIIVRKKYAKVVVAILERIGFQLNTKKSCLSGPFRESCGSNWYNGEDVTPFTLDFALDNLSAMFKFLNLSRRNQRTTSFLEDARRLVLSQLPDRFLFWRPFKGAPDTGIDPPGTTFTRYWQRNKRTKVPIPGKPGGHTYAFYQSWSWVEMQLRPVEDVIEDAPPWVVMAAAMKGLPSSQTFTYRRRTRKRLSVSSGSGDLVSQDLTRVELLQRGASRFWAARGGRPAPL